MNPERKKEIVQLVTTAFNRAVDTHHRVKCDEWNELHLVYLGSPRDGGDGSSDSEATPVSNHCFKNVEILNALLRDMNIVPRIHPRFSEIESIDYNPNEGTGQIYNVARHAADKQSLMDFIWRESRVERSTDACLHDGFEYGTGIAKACYDATGRSNRGIIRVNRVALQNLVLADPCIDDIQRQPWVAEIIPLTYAEVINTYNTKEFPLSYDDQTALKGIPDYRTTMSFIEDQGLFPLHAGSGMKEYDYTSLTTSNMLPVVQMHIKNAESLKKMLFDTGTKEEIAASLAKYDNGVVITFCGDILLEIAPFYYHGLYPYSLYYDYEQPGKAYGIGEVHIAEHINAQINEMWGIIQDNIFLMGSGKVLTEEGMDIDIEDTSAGAIIRAPKGSMASGRVQFVPGTPVPSDHFNYVAAKIAELESITGINEILSGRPPGSGVDAAKAINTLAAMASQRIRPKIKNLSNFVYDLSLQTLSLAIQFYKNRMINIIGQDGTVQMAEVDSMPDESADWYTIIIEGGGALPVSRAAYADTIVQLSQIPLESEGLVDTETLFEALEIPRRYELLKKIEQRRQQAFERQKELVETQASAAARVEAKNNSALLGSSDPTQVEQGLRQIGIGG